MDNRKIAVLLPSAYRPQQLVNCINSLKTDPEPWPVCDVFVSLVSDDPSSIRAIMDWPVEIEIRTPEQYRRGAIWAWNQLLIPAYDYELFVLGADDLVFGPGWAQRAVAALDRLGGSGLVGFNDLSSDGLLYAAHWLASRDFIVNDLGGVMYPQMYKSWWCDREVTDVAQRANKYIWAKDAIVEHFNYTFGKSKVDQTYRDAITNYQADEQLYYDRRARDFPKNYPPVLR